jgi:uncharacterized repeat protein (TIGR01451 family)
MLLLAFLVALAAWFAGPRAQIASASHTVPVTVTITSVDGVGDDLDGIGRGDADFYAGVEFAGGSRVAGNSFSTHVDDDPNITPFWTIPGSVVVVDDSLPATSITLSVWDHDECGTPFCTNTGVFESNDDQLDIKPGDGETVTLTVNLNNGRWTGPINWPTSCVTGDGGEAVKVCFDISVDSGSGDADGDFLLDGWERNGLNADGDASIDVDLPGMGAHPGRKDLFLELDCLVAANHTHCPLQGAIQPVVQAFADAPVNNIDGSTGIQLHVDIGNLFGHAPGADTDLLRTGAAPGGVTGSFGNYGGGGNQIGEAGNLIVDWDGATGRAGTNFYSIKGPPGNNFNLNRQYAFRYGLFVHQVNARSAANDCTSGWAEGGLNNANVLIPGNDMIVSLGGTNAAGNACWGTDAGGNSVGTAGALPGLNQNEQGGTLMHEFGHNLSLDHGGNDTVNRKPNYLSVMNYAFQQCGVTTVAGVQPGLCDFSRFDLPDLDESLPGGLDECVGLGPTLGLGAQNWNGNTLPGGPPPPPLLEGVSNCLPPNNANIQFNINNDSNPDPNNNGRFDPGETPVFSTLTGFEDWNAIRYDFRTQSNFSSGGVPDFPDEATPEIIADARQFLAGLVKPVLAVDKTGPSDATPGDTLSYGLAVTNAGNGAALQTTLTDTKPDASTASFDLGTVVVGATPSRTVTFGVPCSTTDGTVLTDNASVAGTDMLGNAVSASDSLTTTIHAPVLTLTKTATATVNAGEAITYRITYENIGSGAAANVVVTDVLPAGVYYSTALDLGAGPKPTSVTLNANGTRTLVWNVGALAGASGPKTIEYTARPTLLALGGTSYTNAAKLSFTNANGCTYADLSASASTTITVVPPTRNPHTLGFWRTHPEEWTAELRARVQATDQRYDGVDGTTPDGELSALEVAAMYQPGGSQPKVLQMQLLSLYFNLATRRINAGTGIDSRAATALGISNVRDAALYAQATLALPVDSSTRARYDAINGVVDDVNNNRRLVY